MASQKLNFYIAAILNPISDKKCDFYSVGLLVIKKKNKDFVIKDVLPLTQGIKKYSSEMNEDNTTRFESSVIMPGFFDMHFHWVQDDVRVMPKDFLLEWLGKYTFPSEMKFADKKYAKKKAKSFFEKLTSTGTIGGACYSSIHEHAVEAALKEAKGDFVIGNVLMNMNSPEKLTQTEDESLEITKRLIKKHGSRHCFTPRFAITTTPKVMKKGSKMADKAKCFKQTHLSENHQEIEFVLSIYKKLPGFEKVKSYTEIYEKSGMLGEKSLMGHGIHLAPKELKTLSQTKTSIIHCPTSNAPIKERGLGSGLFDFKKTEKAKVRWALGSDIGGGPFLSMFDVMRSFVDQNTRKGVNGATYVKALYRATLAGAEILGKGKVAGNLEKGKDASFIVVPLKGRRPQDAEAAIRNLSRLHRGNREEYDNMVHTVYLKGKKLFSRG
jgi:guanine deaminase